MRGNFVTKCKYLWYDCLDVFGWTRTIRVKFEGDRTNSPDILAGRDCVPVESAREKCLGHLTELWQIATAEETDLAARIYLLSDGLITTLSLTIKELHAVPQTDERPILVRGFAEDISGNRNAVDVV